MIHVGIFLDYFSCWFHAGFFCDFRDLNEWRVLLKKNKNKTISEGETLFCSTKLLKLLIMLCRNSRNLSFVGIYGMLYQGKEKTQRDRGHSKRVSIGW